ncbi:hypothetical protein RHSIM_Rhsim10G0108000 [Rhododendron simsii]|uniref:Uncharacterized protein n=1 Tax=Rhododendron simsii TaxID=118357 RepID=A0A834GDK8_RHOSS|nr:hypothetical protein RHSIM_Rhsim10G0108000 [Rhododendron simsii]
MASRGKTSLIDEENEEGEWEMDDEEEEDVERYKLESSDDDVEIEDEFSGLHLGFLLDDQSDVNLVDHTDLVEITLANFKPFKTLGFMKMAGRRKRGHSGAEPSELQPDYNAQLFTNRVNEGNWAGFISQSIVSGGQYVANEEELVNTIDDVAAFYQTITDDRVIGGGVSKTELKKHLRPLHLFIANNVGHISDDKEGNPQGQEDIAGQSGEHMTQPQFEADFSQQMFARFDALQASQNQMLANSKTSPLLRIVGLIEWSMEWIILIKLSSTTSATTINITLISCLTHPITHPRSDFPTFPLLPLLMMSQGGEKSVLVFNSYLVH